MSFTNKTPNYDLPQYIATDKPTYLVDANGAYLAIDTAMKANETAAATAQSTADTNTAAIGTLNTQINGENGLAADLTAVETLAATTAGSVNTINSLIGNGEPTTTDKTLIGAINELNAGKVESGNVMKYLGSHSFTVTGDGENSYSRLFNALYADLAAYLQTKSANYRYEMLFLTGSVLQPVQSEDSRLFSAIASSYELSSASVNASHVFVKRLSLKASNNTYYFSQDGTITAFDGQIPVSGETITLVIKEYELA